MAALVAAAPGDRFVLDGELMIPADESFSFDALQMRLHPAESRIRKLAAETPALLMLFDMLVAPGGGDLTSRPLSERREALAAFAAAADEPRLQLSPFTDDADLAREWLSRTGATIDGVVAKRLDDPYRSGERAMVKVKRLRSADCVVGGFRYAEKAKVVGSLLLGLYDEAGRLNHVGFTSGLSDEEKPALTRRLEALAGGEGFTGKAPGGPSRWSTERTGDYVKLPPELVVEVRFDHVTGDRFRHGARLLRWRPDKAARQCTMEQLRN